MNKFAGRLVEERTRKEVERIVRIGFFVFRLVVCGRFS